MNLNFLNEILNPTVINRKRY